GPHVKKQAPPSNPKSQPACAPLTVCAHAWGGAYASLWVEPRISAKEAQNRIPKHLVSLNLTALGLAIVLALIWGPAYVLLAIPIWVALFVIGMIAQFAPRLQHREVILTMTDEAVRLSGAGANIVLRLADIVAFRARDGARPHTTRLSLRDSRGDVAY